MFGKSLKKAIREDTSGDYGRMLVYALSQRHKLDAKLLHDAMKGLVRAPAAAAALRVRRTVRCTCCTLLTIAYCLCWCCWCLWCWRSAGH